MQVAAPSPCGPDSSDPIAWPCSSRSPAGKPPAKPVAAQEVSCPPPGLRLGLGQLARTRRCAPGAFDGGSRWPARQLAQGIPTTTTARRWQSYGNADGWTVFHVCPPSRPCQVARSSPFARDASATPAARLASFDLLRLPCITLRRLHRFRPLRSIPVGSTVQTAETGQDIGGRPGQANQASVDPGAALPGSPTDTATKDGSRQRPQRVARLEPSLHSGSR